MLKIVMERNVKEIKIVNVIGIYHSKINVKETKIINFLKYKIEIDKFEPTIEWTKLISND